MSTGTPPPSPDGTMADETAVRQPRRARPPCPAVKLYRPNYWHFDEDSWSWQNRSQIPVSAPAGATINSDDEDVGQVAAALADATLAGGLSTAYHREADDALRRLWHRVHRAESALCVHLDCTPEDLALSFELGDPS